MKYWRGRNKIQFIIPINQDPDSTYKFSNLPAATHAAQTGNQATLTNFWKLFVIKFVLSITIFIAPIYANAGMFSFVSNMLSLSKNEDIKITNSYNSQTLPILRAALNIDPNPSKGGGEIIIVNNDALLSEIGPSGTLAEIEEKPKTSDQISIYVVREGDSLSQIAKMFNVSTNTVIWANDIKSGSFISPGQTLIVLPITGIRHTVIKGETIKSIVEKYDGNLDEALQYNNLTKDSIIAIDDIIVVPDGEIASPAYNSSNINIVTGSGGPTYSGYYIKPVTYGRLSQGLHGYNAVDLAAETGTPIMAAASGEIIISKNSGWNGGYGKYIVIKHNNGTQTLYSHNENNIVYTGQYVIQGQIIGYVGSTGRSTGPHVHFEVRGAKHPLIN